MSKLETLIFKLESENNTKLIQILILITFVLSSSFLAIMISPSPEFDELAYISHVETIETLRIIGILVIEIECLYSIIFYLYFIQRVFR